MFFTLSATILSGVCIQVDYVSLMFHWCLQKIAKEASRQDRCFRKYFYMGCSVRDIQRQSILVLIEKISALTSSMSVVIQHFFYCCLVANLWTALIQLRSGLKNKLSELEINVCWQLILSESPLIFIGFRLIFQFFKIFWYTLFTISLCGFITLRLCDHDLPIS